ncbi:MAG: N-acetyltransferase [Solobacterium sp.]|nr:N-acetyltransferase [Solobacterium sp.]
MIRSLKPEDLAACLDIYNHYIETSAATLEEKPAALEDYQRRAEELTKQYPWLVLEDNGDVKGFAYLSPFNERSAYRITADVTVYLRPQETGNGYGTALLSELITLAEKQSIRKLVSLITASNAASIALHESLGFQKAGELKDCAWKFNQLHSVLFYEKDLTAMNRKEAGA